jgi:hypothetical protein
LIKTHVRQGSGDHLKDHPELKKFTNNFTNFFGNIVKEVKTMTQSTADRLADGLDNMNSSPTDVSSTTSKPSDKKGYQTFATKESLFPKNEISDPDVDDISPRREQEDYEMQLALALSLSENLAISETESTVSPQPKTSISLDDLKNSSHVEIPLSKTVDKGLLKGKGKKVGFSDMDLQSSSSANAAGVASETSPSNAVSDGFSGESLASGIVGQSSPSKSQGDI